MGSTRRDFLKCSAMGVSLSFLSTHTLVKRAFGATASPNRVLLVLQLAGGNDCVNTFIPYTDSRYRTMRPTLAIADDAILKVDDRLGFHPSMTGLRQLYERRRFAFINNVGFSTLDRSHFRCQDVWQTADDSYGQVQRGVSGWLGRFADLYLKDLASSLTSVSISSTNPLGLNADSVLPISVASTESFEVQTDNRSPGDRAGYINAIRGIYRLPRTGIETETIRDQGAETFNAIDTIALLPPPSATADYPGSALGRAFQLAARLIAGEVGTAVIWIRTGGFDTHSQQANTHANLWSDVSDSLAAFDDDLSTRALSDRVMVLGWSEFGRRIQENASGGTDHGKAGTVFVSGGRVRGGAFYGGVPDLGNLDQGDLRTAIDFRAVYSTIIRDWFGEDPLPVLGSSYENVGFIETSAAIQRIRSHR